MVVPTLPVIGVTPPIMFFYILQWLAIAIAYALSITATVYMFVLVFLIPCWMLHRRTPRQRGPSGCCGCMKTVFLCVGRWLCVYTFPALFKMHKTQSDHGNQMRSFMVFLDRKVDNSLALVAAFSCIVFSIFCTSATIFVQYFPVERSEECLEKDNHGRSLFCYTGSSNSSSLPVDCSRYNEIQRLRFVCYTISLPGLGIAVAASLALAKVAIAAVTIVVKVTEFFFKLTKNPPWWCCCGSRNRATGFYIVSSLLLFIVIVPSIISIWTYIFSLHFFITNFNIDVSLEIYYFPHTSLISLICWPLSFIILYLKDHCDKGEYASFAADQRPLDPRDWDLESESSMTAGQQNEAGTGGESGGTSGVAPNETEESVLIDTRGNTEYTEFGATQV